ncbi:hypothetical protein QTP86_021360 [Hemibagrus guttatus]|nr:hypothetical protein QTP86_021360 [Hemibagrus guttatus]
MPRGASCSTLSSSSGFYTRRFTTEHDLGILDYFHVYGLRITHNSDTGLLLCSGISGPSAAGKQHGENYPMEVLGTSEKAVNVSGRGPEGEAMCRVTRPVSCVMSCRRRRSDVGLRLESDLLPVAPSALTG